MKNIIKRYIRKLLLDILEEPEFRPKFKEIKKYKVIETKSPYSIIGNVDVNSYSFIVYYIDPKNSAECTKRYEFSELSELRNCLMNIEPEYDYYNGVTFTIKFNHLMGEQRASDIIINSLNHTVYESSELKNIINPLIAWMDKHPELLI